MSEATSEMNRFHRNRTVSWQMSIPQCEQQVFDISQQQREPDVHHCHKAEHFRG